MKYNFDRGRKSHRYFPSCLKTNISFSGLPRIFAIGWGDTREILPKPRQVNYLHHIHIHHHIHDTHHHHHNQNKHNSAGGESVWHGMVHTLSPGLQAADPGRWGRYIMIITEMISMMILMTIMMILMTMIMIMMQLTQAVGGGNIMFTPKMMIIVM